MPKRMKVTNCLHCGVCCLGQALLPLTGNHLDALRRGVDPEDVLPDRLRLPLVKLLKSHTLTDMDPCAWLTPGGRCAHYRNRPSTCREVIEVGDEVCLRLREERLPFTRRKLTDDIALPVQFRCLELD